MAKVTTYPSAYQNVNMTILSNYVNAFDEPSTTNYGTFRSNKLYEGVCYLTGFDVSSIPQNMIVTEIRLRFRAYWQYNANVANAHMDLYTGDKLIQEYVYTIPKTSYTENAEVVIKTNLTYEELLNLKIKMVINATVNTQTKSFDLYGIALDLFPEEAEMSNDLVISPTSKRKFYLGNKQITKMYKGDKKIYG